MRATDKIRLGAEVGILWRVRLFEGPLLESADGTETTRFRSRKVGALLAYLAMHLGHPCPREALMLALWPDEEDEQVAANRLRVLLVSLRQQLEPPGVGFGSVLDTSDTGRVKLRAETVWCDLVAFDLTLKSGRIADARDLMRGQLLPGYYEEWIVAEQTRLELLTAEWDAVAVAPPRPHSLPRPDPLNWYGKTHDYLLPLYLTGFFGREEEQEQLLVALQTHRMVTLTGSGGVGKTRLAVETACSATRPCLFVPLAELPDPARVPDAILQALHIRAQAGADPLLLLEEALQQRTPLLLLLDNAEHLIDAVATVGLRLLESVPSLSLLVTSRLRLSLPGEYVIGLMPLPPPPHLMPTAQLLDFPAMNLFLDRARNARPDFLLTERNASAIVEICRRLEGLPLALELAAATVTAQSPAQIAEGLAQSLIGLRSRQRGLVERHRSLRAACQSSYELLTTDQRRFLAALSVFQGGWTAEAARAVTGYAEAQTLLEDLVVGSLILAREEEDGKMRYTFLETLRQFAAEQLTQNEREEYTTRHADHFLDLAAHVNEDDIGTFQAMDLDQENLRRALEAGHQSGGDRFWSGLAGTLLHAFVRGNHRTALDWIERWIEREGIDWIERPIATDEMNKDIPDISIRFRIRYAICQILPDIGRYAQTDRIARALKAEAEAVGSPAAAVCADCILGYVAEFTESCESALERQRAALGRARTLSDSALMQMCLSHTSGVLHAHGSQLGNQTEAGMAALREAEALARELLTIVPHTGRRLSLVHSLLGVALLLQGRKKEAYPELKETQRTCILFGTISELMYAFIYESELALEWEQLEHSALYYGAFLALQERMGYSLARAQSFRPIWIQRLQEALQRHLNDRYDSLIARGRQTPPADIVAMPLPLPSPN